MLPDSRVFKITVKKEPDLDGLDGVSDSNFEDTISLLENAMDISLRAISNRVRDEFITRRYCYESGVISLSVRANESAIRSYLENKSFNFEQYDVPLIPKIMVILVAKLMKLGIIKSKRLKLNARSVRAREDNKSLVIRTFSNILIDQVEQIFNQEINLLKNK